MAANLANLYHTSQLAKVPVETATAVIEYSVDNRIQSSYTKFDPLCVEEAFGLRLL
jgi:hypothetical protein